MARIALQHRHLRLTNLHIRTTLCRDQRCWHRRGPGGGGVAHPRINAIFGFNSIQTEGSNRDAPYPMHPALAQAWLEATDPADQLWFGGKWSPQSIAEQMRRLREERDEVHVPTTLALPSPDPRANVALFCPVEPRSRRSWARPFWARSGHCSTPH